MEVRRNAPVQGSFGIPPILEEAAARSRAEAAEKRKKPTPAPEEAAPPEAITDETVKESDPSEVLKSLGVEFTNDSFQHLLFKGFFESEIEVIKGRFKATVRTLTGAEYDEVDELLAAEVKNTDMTNDGFQARRAMWVLSYGVTHLTGKLLAKTVATKDKKIDTMATAKERRKVLSQLAPALTNQLIQKHGAMTMAINTIVAEPDKYLKNS